MMITPTHKSFSQLPHDEVQVFETVPTAKLSIRGYCKYCYTTHRNWWQMRFEDYSADVVLCGHCEHTSLKASV